MEALNVSIDAEVFLVFSDAGHEGSGGDTLRFFGSLKGSPVFANDGVTLQKEWRMDWRD